MIPLSVIARIAVLGWMALVVGAYLLEHRAYFVEKIRVFLPLIIGP
jgi:hypothetical protein